MSDSDDEPPSPPRLTREFPRMNPMSNTNFMLNMPRRGRLGRSRGSVATLTYPTKKKAKGLYRRRKTRSRKRNKI